MCGIHWPYVWWALRDSTVLSQWSVLWPLFLSSWGPRIPVIPTYYTNNLECQSIRIIHVIRKVSCNFVLFVKLWEMTGFGIKLIFFQMTLSILLLSGTGSEWKQDLSRWRRFWRDGWIGDTLFGQQPGGQAQILTVDRNT